MLMETTIIYAVLVLAGIGIGVAITYYFLQKALLKKSHAILEEAKEKAEVVKKEKILQAKEKFLQLKSEHQKLIDENQLNAVISLPGGVFLKPRCPGQGA